MADDFERLCDAVSAVPCSDGDVLGDWLAYASPGDEQALTRAAVLAVLRELSEMTGDETREADAMMFIADLIAPAEGGTQ